MAQKKSDRLYNSSEIIDWILIFILIATCIGCVLFLLGDKAWILYYGLIDFLKQSWFFILGLFTGGE